MQTKDLIKQLQEADPTGEEYITVHGSDISHVENLPSYYDGCQDIIFKDANERPIGGLVRSSGRKIVIKLWSLSDAIFDNPELKVDYSDCDPESAKRYKAYHDKMREFRHKVDYDLNFKNFIKFIEGKVPIFEKEEIEKSAKEFFDKNLKFLCNPEIPTYQITREDGGISYPSFVNRQLTYWNDNIFVTVPYTERKIVIRKFDND